MAHADRATQLAQQVRQALVSQRDLKSAVDALYAELGPFDIAKVIDTGAAGAHLVCLPGYGPLSNPTDYVHIAEHI